LIYMSLERKALCNFMTTTISMESNFELHEIMLIFERNVPWLVVTVLLVQGSCGDKLRLSVHGLQNQQLSDHWF